MHRNKSVSVHQFAMVPRADIPRAAFNIQKAYKTTFDAGLLIPVYCEEVLPGDSVHLQMTAFARLATPITPVMDNLHMDTFFFFVPNRLVWQNWKKFMGEQDNPGDSISYVTPKLTMGVGGAGVGSLYDYFGLPTAGQVGVGNQITVQCLPMRAYNMIYNEWFRDENLCTRAPQNTGDGPDAAADYPVRRRGKRHDYFTSSLPWTQKFSTGGGVSIPLGTTAPIKVSSSAPQARFVQYPAIAVSQSGAVTGAGGGGQLQVGGVNAAFDPGNSLYADLSQATAATINQLRTAFQIQKLLERDARGGTRYTEIVRSHFGVISPDARLQRPEYLGGGTAPIILNPIAQTSGSGLTGGSTPLGNLAAFGTMVAHNHGFSQSFTEHGYIIGIINVRADLTYQQGIRKHWLRSTRYDFYFPAFAMLGEQSVLNKEIFADGSANDDLVFGYQERWAEYRYNPSQVTGLFRSTSAGTIDIWHLAQRFATLPALNQAFIEENPPLSRVLAVGAAANGQQLIFDSVFTGKWVRPMPLYSVPGLIDHF